MARLKTKQISDFTTAVQSLIDNDSDQNAALIDAVEASVDSLETAEDAAIASIDSLETLAGAAAVATVVNASIDSLETLAGAAAVATVVNASIDSLETFEDAAIASIDSLETLAGAAAVKTVVDASIDSLETAEDGAIASIDSLETLAGDNATAISNMLSGSSLDLDTFAEIVSFVESVDTVNDGLVSDLTTNTGASIDSLEVVVSGLSGGSEASIDSLEIFEDAAIASIDSLETALGNEITATDNEVNAINASIDSLELYDLVFEQGGTVGSTTQFTLGQPVKFGVNDDLLVFINGHNIHKNGVVEGATEGYETADGVTFDLISIGYDIDATDHVTVVGIRQ